MAVRKPRSQAITLIAVTFCVYLVLRAIQISFPRALPSTDGAFQTLSAVMRYSSGQIPIHDFYPYLGIGVSASLVPFYVLTGKQLLLSSNLSVAIVLFLANVGGFACLFRICGFRLNAALVATLAIFMALGYSAFDPGNSLRPLRGALPLIVAALLYVSHSRTKGERFTPASAVINGLCLSIAPLWSNDFGPPTFAGFVLAWMIFAPDWRHRAWRNLGTTALVVAMVALVNAPLLVAMGGVTRFLEVQAGFSKDQFWYFGPWGPRVQVFSLLDLRHVFYPPYVRLPLLYGAALTGLIALAGTLALRRFRGRQKPGDATVFAVALAVAGGVMIPQLGGHIEAGYADYALNIVLALVIIEVSRWPRIRVAVVAFAKRPVPLRLLATRRLGEIALPALCLAMCGYFAAFAAVAVFRTLPLAPEAFAARAAIGVFPRSESSEVACFAKVGALFDRYGVPRDRRMLSTYLSALNLAAGADQPMKVDSVIHLLGDRFRAESLARIARARPVLFTTVSPDYTPWDRWNERSSWQLFGPIYRQYEPVARTQQHLIWMRMSDARTQAVREQTGVGRPLSCQVRRESADHAVVSIDGTRNMRSVWSQVTLRNSVTRTGRGIMAPFRSVLTVKESPDTKPFFDAYSVEQFGFFGWRPNRYGVDGTRDPLVVPFDMAAGERSRIDLFVEPAKDWRLDVRSCEARIAAPQQVDPIESKPTLVCGAFLNSLANRLEGLGYHRPAN